MWGHDDSKSLFKVRHVCTILKYCFIQGCSTYTLLAKSLIRSEFSYFEIQSTLRIRPLSIWPLPLILARARWSASSTLAFTSKFAKSFANSLTESLGKPLGKILGESFCAKKSRQESRIGLYAWLPARLSPILVFLRGKLRIFKERTRSYTNFFIS